MDYREKFKNLEMEEKLEEEEIKKEESGKIRIFKSCKGKTKFSL